MSLSLLCLYFEQWTWLAQWTRISVQSVIGPGLFCFRKEFITREWMRNKMLLGWCWFSRAVAIKPHRLSGWNNGTPFSWSSGGRKSGVMESAGLVSSQAVVLGWWWPSSSYVLPWSSLCLSSLPKSTLVTLDSGPPMWPHFNLISSLRIIPPVGHVLS